MPRHKPEKAFKNFDFLNSRDARVVRILSEYIEPEKRLRDAGIEDTVVFFGSARTLPRDEAQAALEKIRKSPKSTPLEIRHAERKLEMSKYYESARELANKLTTWALHLGESDPNCGQRFSVITGGGPGIMEAANRGAHEAGGHTIGMNISLPFEQYPNDYISDGLAFEFHYFFMRKFWMIYLAKAAVIMPGGYGTLDEFMEVLTLVQTEKIRRKLPIVLFGRDYWSKIVHFDPMVEYFTIDLEDLNLFYITDSVDDAFDWLKVQLSQWAIDNPGAGLTPKQEKVGYWGPDRPPAE